MVWWRSARQSWRKELEAGGRLQRLVESGDIRELARRTMTMQSVLLDLHRQLASVQSQHELARTMALALTGAFGSARLVVLRAEADRRSFQTVAQRGDVPPALLQAAPQIAAQLAPFLPHVEPLSALQPPFAAALEATAA